MTSRRAAALESSLGSKPPPGTIHLSLSPLEVTRRICFVMDDNGQSGSEHKYEDQLAIEKQYLVLFLFQLKNCSNKNNIESEYG